MRSKIVGNNRVEVNGYHVGAPSGLDWGDDTYETQDTWYQFDDRLCKWERKFIFWSIAILAIAATARIIMAT